MKITAEKQAAKTMREGIVHPPIRRAHSRLFSSHGTMPGGSQQLRKEYIRI
jgi:hypothetical protein